jgi:hypothetical protein
VPDASDPIPKPDPAFNACTCCSYGPPGARLTMKNTMMVQPKKVGTANNNLLMKY